MTLSLLFTVLEPEPLCAWTQKTLELASMGFLLGYGSWSDFTGSTRSTPREQSSRSITLLQREQLFIEMSFWIGFSERWGIQSHAKRVQAGDVNE